MASSESDIHRPLANFPPSVWGDTFASLSFPESEFESYTKDVEGLRGEVKEMLMASAKEPVENIEFIELLCRLGVSYQFEAEIEEQLARTFHSFLPNFLQNVNLYDLHTFSLLFRVFRQHGYKMPSDGFNEFKDIDGNFKKTIADDIKGVVSLYEAAYLSVHGEAILDEALAFAKATLEKFVASTTAGSISISRLEKYIENALIHPFHRSIPRIEARKYISFYQELESRNETVLKFVILDFNRLQLLHRQDLSVASRWWKDLNLKDKLPYARDRIAEVCFWAITAHFEPEYALSRAFIPKYTKLQSCVDDTFDAYGTYEELQRFADSFERGTIIAADQLPEYMKVLQDALFNLFEETKIEISKIGRSYAADYATEAFKELVRSYRTESQWREDGYIPTYEEYMEKYGYPASSYTLIPSVSFIGLERHVGPKEYEWLMSHPKAIRAAQTIGRLMDDVVTHKEEQKRKHIPSSVECYMNEHGVSEEEAEAEMERKVENAWKDLNEELMRPTAVPIAVIQYILNLSRIIDLLYKSYDAYTHAINMKDSIRLLFLDKYFAVAALYYLCILPFPVDELVRARDLEE